MILVIGDVTLFTKTAKERFQFPGFWSGATLLLLLTRNTQHTRLMSFGLFPYAIKKPQETGKWADFETLDILDIQTPDFYVSTFDVYFIDESKHYIDYQFKKFPLSSKKNKKTKKKNN